MCWQFLSATHSIINFNCLNDFKCVLRNFSSSEVNNMTGLSSNTNSHYLFNARFDHYLSVAAELIRCLFYSFLCSGCALTLILPLLAQWCLCFSQNCSPAARVLEALRFKGKE